MKKTVKKASSDAGRTRAIRIPDRLWEAFEAQAEKEERPVSYFVRKAMEAFALSWKGKK